MSLKKNVGGRLVEGLTGKKRHFPAEGLTTKQIIGGVSIIYKEPESASKYNSNLISHVLVACAF